jgi:hypothetical protein
LLAKQKKEKVEKGGQVGEGLVVSDKVGWWKLY